MSQDFYRETLPSPPPNNARYRPSDFHRLTNRRLTSPASPAISPDFRAAHEPPAECLNDASRTSSVSSSDKRAITTDARIWRHQYGTHENGHGLLNTISSDCVTEDNSGELKQPSAVVDLRNLLPKVSLLTAKMRSGIAQSFLESINTSLPSPSLAPASEAWSPKEAASCECCCRCGKNSTWQPAGRPIGRRARSYTPLRTGISELSGWDREPVKVPEPRHGDVKKNYGLGEAPLERLPIEVLDEIIGNLALDLPPQSYGPRNVDLIHCLLTSKTIHVATINTLYRSITVPHSAIFSKFLSQVSITPGLGSLVRRLDLSHFTSVGLGRSRQSNSEIQNLTAKSLLKCLELTPSVQEVLLQENLDDDIDEHVLHKLFFGLSKLRAIDFCASSSQSFVDAFTTTLSTLRTSASTMLGIKRLSLHECFTLPSAALETLLPRLTQLTHLEVSHTRITDRALASLPNSARLSHLNLGRCIHITGEGVVDFLVNHPAVTDLVYLNLSCDIARYRLLWEADVDRLLPALPRTLRSLNLNGAHIHPRHIPQLLPLTKHLEELGLACADLSLADVNTFFRAPHSEDQDQVMTGTGSSDRQIAQSETQEPWTPPALHYIDLSSIPSISQSSLFNTSAPTNIILTPASLPLEVVELGDKAISSLRECRNTNKRLGWCVKELGRRGWYVREPQNGDDSRGGRRGWKMGAMWWGMRKVPVAWGEVGGLYGHYMFKK